MLKKIFVCFFVVFLLSTMVVPALAVSAGSSGSYVYSSFPITELRINDGEHIGSAIAWPSNITKDNSKFIISDFTSSVSPYSFASVTTYYSFYNDVPQIQSNISLPGDCNKFSFYLDTIFNTEIGDATFSLPVDTAYISEISIQGFYYEPALDGDTYELNFTQFARSWSFSYDREFQTFDMYTYLRSASDNPGNISAFCYANCYIEITLHDYYAANGIACYVESDVAVDDPYGYPFFAHWFDDLKLKHTSTTVAPAGFFDWLLNAVNAFLNLEIFPGFSLNSIFYVVLVITVLLAVIKIMH